MGVRLVQAKLRTYLPGDEPGIVAVWNRALRPDPISLERFIAQVLCDPNFAPEGLQVAECGGEIVGFCLALERRLPLSGDDLEPSRGWITALGVHPEHRGQGVGSSLLQAAERFLQARGKKEVLISPYAPNYFWPGVDEEAYPECARMLASRGYERLYEAVAMDRNLVRFRVPDDVREVQREREREGYVFSRLEPHLVHPVIAFAAERFNPDWGRAVREAVAAGVDRDQFFIATDPQGRVVGFAMHGAYGGTPERFGPFGVDESQRGKGLGKVLLYQTLESMWARGLHSAWFLWTGETTAAGYLYLRAGFEITRRFHILRKRW